MVDHDLGEPGGHESRTAELLLDGEIEVIDIEGIPTVSLEDALAIISAVHIDENRKSPTGWLSYSLVPVDDQIRDRFRDLSERIKNPFRVMGAVRDVGISFADYLAQQAGFEDQRAYSDHKYPEKGSNEDMMYYGISDGNFYFALDQLGYRKEVTLDDVRAGVQGAEDDEVVMAYFEFMQQQFRVNLKCAFECLDPTLIIAVTEDDERFDRGVRVINAISEFLERNGYDKNFSKVGFIDAGEEKPVDD